MKNYYRCISPVLALILLLISAVYCMQCNNASVIEKYTSVQRLPGIVPDYTGSVIPSNIAPLNFIVNESGVYYYIKIYSAQGKGIEISSNTSKIVIPISPWKKLLNANRGHELCFDVYVKKTNGTWMRFETITNTIAEEAIDGYLAYRIINPLYNIYMDINIHQRNLQNYDESVILSNNFINNGCVNCHTFLNNSSDNMLMHTRGWGSSGVAMILARNGVARIVNSRTSLLGSAPMAYSSWHPSGRIIAFSVNKVYQFQHSAGSEVRDVIDLYSELGIYSIYLDTVLTPANISREDRLETYPTWSPDGRYLYFCSAPILWSKDNESWPPVHYKEVKYDLMKISYDMETNVWGEPETVLSADLTGKSIMIPRISPNGRFLLFCMCEYGCFPIFQPSSDLYLMNMETGQYRKLDINSEYSESWHSWSSNSRWIVFSSKRMEGLLTRSFISYVDEAGKVYKPFVLPQKDPGFYKSFLKTFSVPEFIKEPVRLSKRDIMKAQPYHPKIENKYVITDSSKGRFY